MTTEATSMHLSVIILHFLEAPMTYLISAKDSLEYPKVCKNGTTRATSRDWYSAPMYVAAALGGIKYRQV